MSHEEKLLLQLSRECLTAAKLRMTSLLSVSSVIRVMIMCTLRVMTVNYVLMQFGRRRKWLVVIIVVVCSLIRLRLGLLSTRVKCGGEDVMNRSSVNPMIGIGSRTNQFPDPINGHTSCSHNVWNQKCTQHFRWNVK